MGLRSIRTKNSLFYEEEHSNTKDVLEYAGKNLKSRLKGTLREYVGNKEY